jgi:hypothetical protein
MVAKIGGYLGRKNDPPPGHQLIWQGYAALRFMSLGFALRVPDCLASVAGKGQR